MTLQSRGPGTGDARRDEIAALGPWFHNLHLPDGAQTAPDHPLGDFPAYKWREIARALPADLSGATALDIGCNAGFHSFQLAARGARVTAIDSDEHYLRQARWAARWLDEDGRITFERMQVYDLAALGRRFDVVLFLGVLYHLRYPQLALDLVSRVVGELAVVQTLTMPAEPGATASDATVPENLAFEERSRLAQPGWPRAAFVEHRLADDPTNWWVPDDACARAMLRAAGLRIVSTPGCELYVCEPDHDEPAARAGQRESELRAVLEPSSSESSSSQRK